ncbi:class I SAM-dependent methyltransferase [Mucilaginibacter sabulilitoris]|uniref:Class I SAM-dependent methyltransferase n=1 Tax=Mucilaginibacter sabulilitoris TaxID=1173583 RepID=A0ABZ0THZ3_9SPHI|nr:class I SAM-dependent methyltransferase [Mucilaginibacter sabulilitoris]WPU91339.1 class I SAM-dependent methyltransferase [Mucilaginibacter sabulilitoris]
MLATIKNYLQNKLSAPAITEKSVVEAYDLWSAEYDMQPDNLMLHLDGKLFSNLISQVDVKGKQVADIGCGTGRHWPLIFSKEPADLTGFDVSGGMLEKLKQKYPAAHTRLITNNLYSDISDSAYDIIISTLTVAHIEDIEEAMQAWSRLLKSGGEIIITDFHPHTLAFGGKRTFKYNNAVMAVRNYVHPIYTIKEILLKNNFLLLKQEEVKIDESMKPFYAKQNAMHVYEKYKDFPVIYGIHLKKE